MATGPHDPWSLLADKVAFLKSPSSYPEGPRAVEALETHMAWVFLTDRHAYKLKKPVRSEFLDFSTLEARRRDCEDEVRLNRRLAADVYLRTVALTGEQGDFELEGQGAPVDWLVKMRRLPGERMLDAALRGRRVTADDIHSVAALLSDFYLTAAHKRAMTADAYLERYHADLEHNRQALLASRDQLPAPRVRALIDHQMRFLEHHRESVGGRAAHVLEAHGDLRPEHVCLTAPPAIIDCLEFSLRFRTQDPADELAFLAMECDRLGAAWIGTRLVQGYCKLTGDTPSPRLMAFYKSYRACLRAKLAIMHLRETPPREPQRWRDAALAYLALAEGALGQMG